MAEGDAQSFESSQQPPPSPWSPVPKPHRCRDTPPPARPIRRSTPDLQKTGRVCELVSVGRAFAGWEGDRKTHRRCRRLLGSR